MKKMGNEKTTKAIAARLAVLFITLAMLFTSMPFGLLTYANEAEDTQAATEQSTDAASQTQTQTEPKDKASETPNTEPKDTPTETPKAEPKEEPKKETPKEESKDESNADDANEDPDNGVLEVSSPVGSYTVDFYFTAEDGTETEYHLKGGSEIMLSELFAKLGINRDTADIKKTVFTDNELVKFVKEGDDYRVISLKPFDTEESLTITFEDGDVIKMRVTDATTGNRTPEGNVNWNLAPDGTLTIRLSNSVTSGGFTTDRKSQAAWNGFWATTSGASTYIRADVKKVIIKKNEKDDGYPISINNRAIAYMFSGFTNLESVEIQEGALSGSPTNIASMFRDCKKLKSITGLEYLDTTNVQDMSSTFNGVGSDTTGLSLDLSAWKNNGKVYNLQNMFANSGITEVTLNNKDFKTRPYANGGCPMGAMFFNSKIKKIDMSNITLTGRPSDTTAKTGHDTSQEAGAILSTNRNGNATLETVIMNNTKFVDMADFSGMFSNCPKLTNVQMTLTRSEGDTTSSMAPSAVNMNNMFANSVTSPSGIGTPTIDVSGFGKLDHIVNMDGFVNGCIALQVLNIDNLDNSRIKPNRGNHTAGGEPDDDPGAAALGVDWGRMFDLDTCKALNTISAKKSNVWMTFNEKGTPSKEYFLAENDNAIYKFTNKQFTFASDVGPTIEVETKRDYVDLMTDRQEAGKRGSNDHLESATNKNMKGGSHLNTNGAGFLAPGFYTIGDTDRTNPSLEAPITYYRITEMGKPETTRKVEILESLDDLLIKDPNNENAIITAERSISDFWEKGLVDEDKILEKYEDGEYKTLATITYKGAATDINGNKHDVIVEIKRITFKDVKLIPNTSTYTRRTHDSNWVAKDKYYRTVLEAQNDKIKLNNYVRSTSATNGLSTSDQKVLSQGSGTYIDFDIKIDKAKDGTSLLFYIDDLDVPHAQDWKLDDDDACYDELTWEKVTYGDGSEGMVLGNGNDIDTLAFADHTGLQLLNRNYVVSTGSDPSTNWSEFYVRANAQGSSYTWTSGIGCDTDLLKNTDPVPAPKKVWVMPEAIKYVNSTIPKGDYANKFFGFTFAKAAGDVEGSNYEYYGKARSVTTLTNNAENTPITIPNKGEFISLPSLPFPVPTGNDPVKYIYQVTENPGSSTEIINYDTDTTHYMQVVVFRPSNDIEMYQGTRAEIIFGTKQGDGQIGWNTDDVYVVYATNAQEVEGKSGPQGVKVFIDAQGIEFYRVDDKFYRYSDNQEMQPTKHAQVDRKISYNGSTYQVKVDKNGVEYFQVDNEYHDPNDPARKLITASTGDIDPDTIGNDSPVAVAKKVNEQEVKKDVHGVEYYGEYFDISGNKITVKDGAFNPHVSDITVYESKKSKTGETVFKHANGKEYYVKNGNYYDPETDAKLTTKIKGEVDPLPSDQNAKSNELKTKRLKETFSGKGYDIKLESKHGVEYYKDSDGKYYTRYGTLLEEKQGVFTPSDKDEYVTVSQEIWIDGAGTRFYKNEGQYYKEADDKHMNALAEGTLDTSEVVNMGSFNNTTNVSDITVIKNTEGGKAGKFKIHVKFDNGFVPRFVVYEPASQATFSKVAGTEDTWEFTVEDGQRMTIKDVPLNTGYEITEPMEKNGWELIDIVDKNGASSNTGTVTTQTPNDKAYNPDYVHTVKNRLTEVIVDKYERTTTTGSQSFSFTVEISGLTPKIEYPYGWLNETNQEFDIKTADDDGKITATFSLKDEEDIALVVPKGSNVKVTETAVDGYVTEVQNGTGDKTKANEITIKNVEDTPRNELHFINTKIDPITINIPVEKILKGRKWSDLDAFGAVLILREGDQETPMPADFQTKGDIRFSEVVIDNNGTEIKDGDEVIGYSTSFGAITYDKEMIGKTYTYKIRELTPAEDDIDSPIPGVTYDTTEYDATVAISLDESDDKHPKLVADLTLKKGDQNVSSSRFANVYSAEQAIYKMEAVKDYHDVLKGTGIELKGNDFKFALKPIGDNAKIAPMPKATTGSEDKRMFITGNEAGDGDIEFEDPEDANDGLVFNYAKLLEAGISDEDLHKPEGVDFEYEMYELIPGTPEGIANELTLKDGETLVNNDNGTWSIIGDDIETVYDGIHHTRKVTVKVITDPVTKKPVLDVEGHADDHKEDFFINSKGEEQAISTVPGYKREKHHFKPSTDDLGAPIFINYHFKQQYVDLKVNKVWDDADDQDEIRPKSVKLTIESDEGDYKPAALEIKGSTWTASEKLPIWKFDANTLELSEIEYTVKEYPVPTGYTVSYSPNASSITLDPSKTEFALTVTNKHVPGESDIEGDETYGLKGRDQTGTPKYDVNPKNPVTPTGLVKPEKEGATISDDGKTVTIPGEGKYVLNDDGTITFTPDPEFVGDPTPVDVKGKDKQGNEKTATYKPHVKDSEIKENVKRTIHYRKIDESGEVAAEDKVQEVTLIKKATKIDPKTGDITWEKGWEPATFPAADNPKVPGWYTNDKVEPLTVKKPGDTEEYVIYKEPTIEGDKSYGLKGQEQTGTPNYEVDPDNPITPVKLVKPDKEGATISDDGKTVTIPGEGKYVLNDDGTITFTPEPEFVGDPTPVDVMGKDKHGNEVSCTYTPHVVDPEDKAEVKRIIKFTYEKKDGTPVTDSITQIGTIVRKALEVDPKTGEVTKWGPWSSYTFPAVKNPDKEAGAGWTTSDSVSALTVDEPGKVADAYVVYVKKHYTVTYEDGDHGSSNGGSRDKEYGDTPQGNKVKADDGYKFTGRYKYVITDENGKIIDSGTTDNPKSIEVIGNIVFTPEYEKIIEPEPEPDNDSKANPKSSGGTATGDYTRIGIWVALIAAAMAAIIFVIIRRRRSE